MDNDDDHYSKHQQVRRSMKVLSMDNYKYIMRKKQHQEENLKITWPQTVMMAKTKCQQSLVESSTRIMMIILLAVDRNSSKLDELSRLIQSQLAGALL